MSKGSEEGWPSLTTAALAKKTGKGRFDMHSKPGEAEPSRAGLPPPAPLAGHKRTVVPSQSLKKTPSKVAQQLQVQYQLSQQDLQLAPAHVYLPSAPMGAPRSFETTKRSLALGSNERERLEWEVIASEVLYTQYGGILGTTRAVLQQPAQPTGNDELRVPRIQDDELCVRNAGANLWDQARVQNVKHFLERDKQRQQQPTMTEAVDQLMSSIAGQPIPPAVGQPQDVPPPLPTDLTKDNQMDTGALETEPNQDDAAMDNGHGAHELECTKDEEVDKEA